MTDAVKYRILLGTSVLADGFTEHVPGLRSMIEHGEALYTVTGVVWKHDFGHEPRPPFRKFFAVDLHVMVVEPPDMSKWYSFPDGVQVTAPKTGA